MSDVLEKVYPGTVSSVLPRLPVVLLKFVNIPLSKKNYQPCPASTDYVKNKVPTKVFSQLSGDSPNCLYTIVPSIGALTSKCRLPWIEEEVHSSEQHSHQWECVIEEKHDGAYCAQQTEWYQENDEYKWHFVSNLCRKWFLEKISCEKHIRCYYDAALRRAPSYKSFPVPNHLSQLHDRWSIKPNVITPLCFQKPPESKPCPASTLLGPSQPLHRGSQTKDKFSWNMHTAYENFKLKSI